VVGVENLLVYWRKGRKFMETVRISDSCWMIYGAGGFSGRLIAEEAVRRGHRPILAGRRAKTVVPVAEKLRCPYRVFPSDGPEKISPHIDGIQLLLNCAGPFSQTAKPVVTACLQKKVHYLDINGEHMVIHELVGFHEMARANGVVILPAVGFGVVPSDCLAAKLANRHPEANVLRVAFTADRTTSKGTAKSMWEGAIHGCFIRLNGRLVKIPLGRLVWNVPFPSGDKLGVGVPWADIETAYYSTKIPNIVTYATFPPVLVGLLRLWHRLSRPSNAPDLPVGTEVLCPQNPEESTGARLAVGGSAPRTCSNRPEAAHVGVPSGLADEESFDEAHPSNPPRLTFAGRFIRNLGWVVIDLFFRNPKPAEISEAKAEFYAEVSREGKVLGRLALQTPGGYRLTVDTALKAVESVLTASPPPGFHTPATAFGEDFILKIPSTTLA
jgi:short subunit dehydrogenase-like uncharacterized protein